MCKFSHPRDKDDSPKVLSPIPNIASPQLQASPIRDDSPSPRPPSPIVQRPTSNSAWYQGAGSGSEADVPKGEAYTFVLVFAHSNCFRSRTSS
jgi:hypothetical protein